MRKFFLSLFLFIFVSQASAADLSVTADDAVTLPVVMYHLVTKQDRYVGRYGITPDALDSDLAYLADNGFNTVVIKDVHAYVTDCAPLPDKPVMLTFDDGNSSDYSYVLPLLKKHGMKAVLSVMGKQTDQYTSDTVKNNGGSYPNLTWPQLKEIAASGLAEIQSHAYDLHTKGGAGPRRGEATEAYKSRLSADLNRLQERCAAELGVKPNAFAYPLGVYGAGSEDVLKSMGFVASFSCTEGINTVKRGEPQCLFMLKRCIRPSGKHISEIVKPARVK
jgi:peptidoglycan/xylan/chitin deacetylase (PgdA/CDA1 family)